MKIEVDGVLFKHMEDFAKSKGLSTDYAIEQAFSLYLASQLIPESILNEFHYELAKATYLKDHK